MAIKSYQHFLEYATQNDVRAAIIRCDFNIPSDVQDYTRIHAIRDTILQTLNVASQVILISHYKRPTPNIREPRYSLSNVLHPLSSILERDVCFVQDDINMINNLPNDKIVLLENLRYYPGESKNDVSFAKQIAKFGNVYINDAFSVCHRSHASVEAITRLLPSFAGISLTHTINSLDKIVKSIERPYTAIIGGSKISTKIDALKTLSQIADNLVICGAMANVFLAANNVNMQNSLVERDYISTAASIMQESRATILLPTDFMCSESINVHGELYTTIPENQACFDIGAQSISNICDILDQSKTVMWNGATGAFEFSNFNQSSIAIANKLSTLNAVKVIGGGETVASIPENIRSNVGFICTAGGAFLEYIGGKTLSGLNAISQ